MTTDNSILDDSNLIPADALGSPDLNLLAVTGFEAKVLRRALKRLRYEAGKDHRRNQAAGWTPEPGKHDVILLTLNAIESLLARLPYSERAVQP